ncbi:DNA-3-methyladenine glycosylase family protein [Brevibacillus choshinensis]|uniref:DNA-3-methyladenine glycosylase II n=1 Tax=Brevibacillus choshinensis TaxID=54911 RepID=A0ABX7FRV4_BRECH|nr:DNA-3-methyladenine glycosylase 2 family protein [Brevibacillus choshinensis]QRG68983.1 DNA-3-methyladenine glycosylase 2 family protein [Brevibacillus choshinensis]
MNNHITFHPSHEGIVSLCSQDTPIRKLIHHIGPLTLKTNENHLEALVMSIIGQQLSAKAASTIRQRVKMLCGEITPERVLRTPIENLRNAGVSRTKIEYIFDLCKKVHSNEISFANFHSQENETVINSLTSVKGIGKWTAEMFLLFSLGRLNVLSLGDAGLQRATKWLYQLDDRPKNKYMEEVSANWHPYYSIVSLYLWESIDLGFVDHFPTLEDVNEK